MKIIHETGECPTSFTETTMITVRYNPIDTKCSDHRAVSLIEHAAKIGTRIDTRRIERKIEDANEDWIWNRKIN
jgi:hypothetical protein